MNKKALKAADYARVRVLPYPIRYDRRGLELPPPPNDVWIMKSNDDSITLDCPVGDWTVAVDHDFIDNWSNDASAPLQGPKRAVLRLHGLIHLPPLDRARFVRLTPQTVDQIILEQDRLVAAQLAQKHQRRSAGR